MIYDLLNAIIAGFCITGERLGRFLYEPKQLYMHVAALALAPLKGSTSIEHL